MKLFSENIYILIIIDTLPRKLYNISVNKIRKLVNIMNTLTYNLPNDIYTYVITCNDEQVDAFTQLLIDEGAYKILLNNEVIYNGK